MFIIIYLKQNFALIINGNFFQSILEVKGIILTFLILSCMHFHMQVRI